MSNVLSEAKKQQVIALGRLGWLLRRIEQETGVRRETAGAYLKAAGIGVRPPQMWGRRPLVGYRILRQAKSRGATVIMGGIHATIFPDEPLEMGADAVVTGNGDVVWAEVIKDALDHNLKRRYVGGRVSGEALLRARWDLLDPTQYMFATVQTVAGCPENCSFCSVWVTDGRQPRQRLADKIIEEVNELYALGFRYIVFADDNFNPATLGRIAREPSSKKRKELEQIREQRLQFFDEYSRADPRNMYAFTKMTT